MSELMERLCIHTATTRPLPLEQAVELYAAAGVRGVTVWRDVYQAPTSGARLGAGPGTATVTGDSGVLGPRYVGEKIRSAGLSPVALCRGGFFVSTEDSERRAAVEENRAIIREAAEMDAPVVVLVCGAAAAVGLGDARGQIRDAIESLLPLAEEAGVDLAIEPLHPMYAGDRSAVNTMASANDLCDALGHPRLGVAVDVYHVWWDPDLRRQIQRCGERIKAFHVCDWRVETRDLLNDRGLMGEGCIPIRQIRSWVEESGFDGFCEVEIFSTHYWAMDQRRYVSMIVEAFREHV